MRPTFFTTSGLYDKPNYSKEHTTIEGDGNG